MRAKTVHGPYHDGRSDELLREQGRVLYWWPSFTSPDRSAVVGRKMLGFAIAWLVMLIVLIFFLVLILD